MGHGNEVNVGSIPENEMGPIPNFGEYRVKRTFMMLVSRAILCTKVELKFTLYWRK